MAAVSVVKKLQRCERITRDDHHVVKYKIKIKETCAPSSSSIPTIHCCSLPFTRRALAELTDPLIHVAPITSQHNYHQDLSSYSSALLLQEHDLLHPHQLSSLHQGGGSFARSPLKLQTETLQGLPEDSSNPGCTVPACKLQHEDEDEDSSLGAGSKSPCKLQTKTISKVKINGTLMLEEREEQEEMWAMFPCKLKLHEQHEEEEEHRAREKDDEVAKRTDGAPKSPEKAQEKNEEAAPRKLRQKEKTRNQGKREEWEVKKVECECCGMEEEYTRGYEERVRGRLCGHWLCGLCEEAVREERQRLGGRVGGEISLQVALQAHMEPCRGFSSRARAKACPPPSAVAVPDAVCRLLRRHLSTPFPSPRPGPSLPRSCSCLPSLDHSQSKST